MTLKNSLLMAIAEPRELRELLIADLLRKLETIGITVHLYELHAPAPGAKKQTGLGVTLCSRPRGMRNPMLTCKRCLAKLAKQ